MSVQVLQGNALALPLADDSVDLVVTSPPYFGLRSYQDAGEHYDGQLGSETTPAEFVDALICATREMVRVVKPSGSIWVNLGDKYAGPNMGGDRAPLPKAGGAGAPSTKQATVGAPTKSLIGVPWRYALRCIDDLGLILRAEVIWSKPNGLPESVTDRVRRSHETWFHFTLNPRYYSAVDEIREEHAAPPRVSGKGQGQRLGSIHMAGQTLDDDQQQNPLGKLPGSVWSIPTQPLTVPAHLGVDHFAAFPMEWPRRIVTGWSPREVCTACGEGRRPVTTSGGLTDEGKRLAAARGGRGSMEYAVTVQTGGQPAPSWAERRTLSGPELARMTRPSEITGYACACPHPTAPATPGVVLDPFGGTGTTALVAHALGRRGISIDMSADYCRLARWRTSDPKELARAQRREYVPPREQVDGQETLFEGLGA